MEKEKNKFTKNNL